MLKLGLLFNIIIVSFNSYANATLDDYSKVAETIQYYFDGTQHGKPDLVRKAFTETLYIQWIDKDGKFRSRGAKSYIERIKVDQEVPRFGHIVSMDITNKGASAKVEINWRERRIVDYLLLLKINGQWKITNKIAAF
jgi:hypothetical protein